MKVLNRVWAALLLGIAAGPAFAAAKEGCANPNAIGVARTVEIDTTGGPGFGFEHYKANDFLQQKEVVLTFDDGPQKFSTEAILAALADQCVKATFFSIGKMALGYPEIIREVSKAGHTIGTHTWSHQAIRKLKTFEEGRDEIERGVSAVKRAVGGPIAPFFRYPTLVDTPESLAHLGKRKMAMFSTDIDSFDFKIQSAESIVKTVMSKLDKQGKGIVLMHDIHKTTAKAVPLLLAELKAKGYRIVHMRAKGEVKTLAEYDAMIEKDAKGLPVAGAERPVSSFVKTVEGPAPEAVKPAETAATDSNPEPVTSPAANEPNAATDEPKSEAALEATAAATAPAPAASAAPATTASISTSSPSMSPVHDASPEPSSEKSEAAPAPKKPRGWMQRASDAWHALFGE